jgi:hypothetical protein
VIAWRAICALAALALGGCGAEPLDPCAPGDDVVCGITKPEDIEIVAGTRWLLVSELGGATSPGRILAVDPVTKERRVLAESALADDASPDSPRCGPPPAALRPRGFHLGPDGGGGSRLLVIAGQRVERFRVNRSGDDVALAWDGCVEIPPEIMANDVAGFADGGFVVSHMYDNPRTIWTNIGFLFGLGSGSAMAWSAESGWSRVPGTEASFANGIQVDPRTARIYVSSMFTQRIIGVDRGGGNRLEGRRGPAQIDNLSWAEDGRLIGAGHTGLPIWSVAACRDFPERPCAFPFAIVAYDPATLTPSTLLPRTAGGIPGASVAVLKDGAFHLGSAFGDRMTRVSLR